MELGTCAIRRQMNLVCSATQIEVVAALTDACSHPRRFEQEGASSLERPEDPSFVAFGREQVGAVGAASLVLADCTDGYEPSTLRGRGGALCARGWNRVVEDFAASVAAVAARRVDGLRCDLGPAHAGPAHWFDAEASMLLGLALRDGERPHHAWGCRAGRNYMAFLASVDRADSGFHHEEITGRLVEAQAWPARDANDLFMASNAAFAAFAHRDRAVMPAGPCIGVAH